MKTVSDLDWDRKCLFRIVLKKCKSKRRILETLSLRPTWKKFRTITYTSCEIVAIKNHTSEFFFIIFRWWFMKITHSLGLLGTFGYALLPLLISPSSILSFTYKILNALHFFLLITGLRCKLHDTITVICFENAPTHQMRIRLVETKSIWYAMQQKKKFWRILKKTIFIQWKLRRPFTFHRAMMETGAQKFPRPLDN